MLSNAQPERYLKFASDEFALGIDRVRLEFNATTGSCEFRVDDVRFVGERERWVIVPLVGV